MKRMHGSGILTAFVVALSMAACSQDSTPPIDNVLRGLSEGSAGDSSTTPPPQTTPTPGSFHGVVLGQGTGPDTIGTAPRLSGVTVTGYRHMGWNGGTPVTGDKAMTVTTNAQGEFQSPVLDGGDYVFTFVPPESSEYRGVYVTYTVHSGSNTHGWLVVLPRK